MAALLFYLERPDRAIAAFTDADGLSVPIYTDQEKARAALEGWAEPGTRVAMISSSQVKDLGETCRAAGALSLRMDPELEEIRAGGLTFLSLT